VISQVYTEESLMKTATVHFYENLLHDDQPQRVLIEGISYDSISMDALAWREIFQSKKRGRSSMI